MELLWLQAPVQGASMVFCLVTPALGLVWEHEQLRALWRAGSPASGGWRLSWAWAAPWATPTPGLSEVTDTTSVRAASCAHSPCWWWSLAVTAV